ncbi:MAG: dethiobiotin synthase [Myxococcota bacterium]|nr:dethiobiotin synthase [Myxococcota bacterium]
MSGQLVVVTGTGTGIGKTHFAEALVLAWRRKKGRIAGLKPVESGVTAGTASDAARLAAVSSFHVKQFGVSFAPALSPHLCAREAGSAIDLTRLAAGIAAARQRADGLVLELPGGLFTPLSDTVLNADWAASLAPDLLLVVAPDRLGVLHDALACVRAARAMGLRVAGLIVVHPGGADPSTGRNAAELERLGLPVLASLPRAPSAELCDAPDFANILSRLD